VLDARIPTSQDNRGTTLHYFQPLEFLLSFEISVPFTVGH